MSSLKHNPPDVNRGRVVEYTGKANPRDSWPSWTDEVSFTVADPEPLVLTDAEFKLWKQKQAEDMAGRPDVEQAAEALGLLLALDGVCAGPCEGWPVEVATAFRRGHDAGRDAYASARESDGSLDQYRIDRPVTTSECLAIVERFYRMAIGRD